MHDKDRLGVPPPMLRKEGPLTTQEWDLMRTHPAIGAAIPGKSQAPVFRMAAKVSLRHHEKWDGSGQPDGLAGTAIPGSARIVALAGVFDALSMRRSYKDGGSIEPISRHIEAGSGIHFAPKLVELFHQILPPPLLPIKAQWDEENATPQKAAQ